jgi:hypothetical protein
MDFNQLLAIAPRHVQEKEEEGSQILISQDAMTRTIMPKANILLAGVNKLFLFFSLPFGKIHLLHTFDR